MKIYFSTRQQARNHCAKVKSHGWAASVKDDDTNINGRRYSVFVKPKQLVKGVNNV